MTLLSMNEITTFRWSFEQDVENYLQAGYQSIGVWRQKLSDMDEDDAIDLLAGSGLNVSNLMWAGGFTGSCGRSLKESIEDAADALRTAAAISAGCLVVFPGGRNNHTTRHALRLVRTALAELLPLAEAVEVPLAIKPIHAGCSCQCSFINDLATVVELIDEFCSPWLKLAYDTYHFPFGPRRQHQLASLAPYLGIVHLGDRHAAPRGEDDRCALGTGRLHLREMITTLQEAGYTGAFDVQLIGPDIEPRDYWNLLEQSQQLFHETAAVPAPRTLA